MKGFNKASAWIVDENSARFSSLHEFVRLVDADHRTVCKPKSKTNIGYLKLIECINHVIEEYNSRITIHLSIDPIGIEGKIDKISKLLESPEVSMVGLFGMGGAGKTTLSKAFYNRNAFMYVKSCYLENVKSKGIQDVQKELLQGLCGKKLDQIEGVEKKHLDMIKDCLLNQKVLVVVDDVSSEKCLRELQLFHALEIGSQSSQSKVVVTTRDRAILPKKYLDSCKAVMEPMDGITEGSDLELFLRYALDAIPLVDKEKVKSEFCGEAKKIVQLCNGLPLSLEVLGKYLGNSKDEDEDLQKWKETWTDAFKRLQKAQSIGGDKLWSSLRISYDHLGDLEKKMFLDFACVFSEFSDMNKRHVEWIWDSPTAVKNLVNKSLLKVQDGRFVMHDQLRDMGRHMLLDEALKDYQHPIYLVEGNHDSLNSLLFLKLLYGFGFGLINFSKPFEEMQKLTTESGVPYIASVQGQEEEKSLHGYSKLRIFFASKFNTSSLVDDCLSQCSKDLRWLYLEDCPSVTKIGIQKLCSFGGLRMLHIYSCDKIVELPEEIGKLINLVEMEVVQCFNLQSLPDTIGGLKKLKRLVIEYCRGLQAVPVSVGELCEVEHLSFKGCNELKVIQGTQICTLKLMELRLPIVPTTCLRPCPHLRRLDIANNRGAKEFPHNFFKVDMPKLEGVLMWRSLHPEVVIKNPDGSELVLKIPEGRGSQMIQVHRQRDGSILRLS